MYVGNQSFSRRVGIAAGVAGVAGLLGWDLYKANRVPLLDEDAVAAAPRTPLQVPMVFDARASDGEAWTVNTLGHGLENDVAILLSRTPTFLERRYGEARDPGISAVQFWGDVVADFRIVHLHADGSHSQVDFQSIDSYLYAVSPIPGGEYLVVNSRAEGDRPNAKVYDATGENVREFWVGDGIEEAQVARDGTVWVSYFDEGIFGDTIAQEGLIAFDSDGSIEFRFNDRMTWDNDPWISDCYALNVIDDEVFAFIYADFPFVRIRDHKIHTDTDLVKRAPIAGSSAVAVTRDRYVFASPYDLPTLLVSANHDGSEWALHEPVDVAGTSLSQQWWSGRGSRMSTSDGVKVWSIDTAGIPIG